jgi:hypothetical protein
MRMRGKGVPFVSGRWQEAAAPFLPAPAVDEDERDQHFAVQLVAELSPDLLNGLANFVHQGALAAPELFQDARAALPQIHDDREGQLGWLFRSIG